MKTQLSPSTYRQIRPLLRICIFVSLALLVMTFYATLFGLALLILNVSADTFPRIFYQPLISGLACILSTISTLCFMWVDDKTENSLRIAV